MMKKIIKVDIHLFSVGNPVKRYKQYDHNDFQSQPRTTIWRKIK